MATIHCVTNFFVSRTTIILCYARFPLNECKNCESNLQKYIDLTKAEKIIIIAKNHFLKINFDFEKECFIKLVTMLKTRNV